MSESNNNADEESPVPNSEPVNLPASDAFSSGPESSIKPPQPAPYGQGYVPFGQPPAQPSYGLPPAPPQLAQPPAQPQVQLPVQQQAQQPAQAPASAQSVTSPFARSNQGQAYGASPMGVSANRPYPAYPASSDSVTAAELNKHSQNSRRNLVALVVVLALVLGGLAGFGGAFLANKLNNNSQINVANNGTQVDNSSLSRPAESIAGVVETSLPSVVSIEAIRNSEPVATGSGFVIRADGYILTNAHVVAPSDGNVKVRWADGSMVDGKVVGETTDYDLAVIKVDATDLVPLAFGDSDSVVVGDSVIAIGAPLGLDSTVTSGIISALHRPVIAGEYGAVSFIDAIQTDAAINPGNSGGPLLNARGEVIGVNSAIATTSSSSEAGSVGLGFAIPSNQAKRTAEELIATGKATYPALGVMLDERYVGEGVKILNNSSGIVAGSPAEKAGIKPGEIITKIDGRPVAHSTEIIVAVRAKAVGEEVVLTIGLGDDARDVTLKLISSTDVNYDKNQDA